MRWGDDAAVRLVTSTVGGHQRGSREDSADDLVSGVPVVAARPPPRRAETPSSRLIACGRAGVKVSRVRVVTLTSRNPGVPSAPHISRSRFTALVVTATAVVCVGCSAPLPDSVNSSFDFTTNAFTFTNFDNTKSGGKMNAELAARMFGDAPVCKSGSGASCVPTDAAQAWLDEMNVTLDYGHSEGIAVLSLLMWRGTVSASDFGGATASVKTKVFKARNRGMGRERGNLVVSVFGVNES